MISIKDTFITFGETLDNDNPNRDTMRLFSEVRFTATNEETGAEINFFCTDITSIKQGKHKYSDIGLVIGFLNDTQCEKINLIEKENESIRIIVGDIEIEMRKIQIYSDLTIEDIEKDFINNKEADNEAD